MRRSLKIKTFILLLAWLVIFAHNVIPHNHVDEFCSSYSDICHKSSADLSNQMMSARLVNQPADDKVCHLSNLLFQNFNPENLFPHSQGQIIFLSFGITGKIYVYQSESFISPHSCSSVSFRAPPMA